MNHDKEMTLHTINILCHHVVKCDTEDRAMQLLEAMKLIRQGAAGMDDFVKILDIVHEQIIRVIYNLRGEGKESVTGIYAILFCDGMVKIGKTKNFNMRLKALSDQSTSGVSASRFFPCEHYSKAEAIAHAAFSSCRVKNEFFKADFHDVLSLLAELTEKPSTTTH